MGGFTSYWLQHGTPHSSLTSAHSGAVQLGGTGNLCIGFPAEGDVRRRSHVPIGHAPGLAVFIEIDDPDQIVVAVTGFDKIGDALARGTGPAVAADDDSNQWRIQLQHSGSPSKRRLRPLPQSRSSW